MAIDKAINNVVKSIKDFSSTVDRSTKAVLVFVSLAFSCFFAAMYWRGYKDKEKEVDYWKGMYQTEHHERMASDSARNYMNEYWINVLQQQLNNNHQNNK